MTELQLEKKLAKEASSVLNEKFTHENLMEWRLGKYDEKDMEMLEGDKYIYIPSMNVTCIFNNSITVIANSIQNKEYTPMSKWGKDHWSTLAYIDTVITDYVYFPIIKNDRMRTTKNNLIILHNNGIYKKEKFIRDGSYIKSEVEVKEYPTRLNDGTEIKDHDDFSCIVDFAKEGLLNKDEKHITVDSKIKLSKLGRDVINKLREHKSKGKNFADFIYVK